VLPMNGTPVRRAGSNNYRRKEGREESMAAKQLATLAKGTRSSIAAANKNLSSDSESEDIETAAPTTDEVSKVGAFDCSL